MELTENILERNGCQIHYWTGDKTDAPLVVFTHGATIDHHEWDPTLPLVTAAGFRVLVWDVRGHGLRIRSFGGFEVQDQLRHRLFSFGLHRGTFVPRELRKKGAQ